MHLFHKKITRTSQTYRRQNQSARPACCAFLSRRARLPWHAQKMCAVTIVGTVLNATEFIKFSAFPMWHLQAEPSPPGLLRGICPPCQSRGWGICKVCTAWGPGIYQPRDHSQAFDLPAVSYQNMTTQKVLLKKTQIGLSVKDRNKLKRVVKACSQFYACISSLLIKPELHSETRELLT